MRSRFFPLIVVLSVLLAPRWSSAQVTAKIVGGSKAPTDTYRWIVALADVGSRSLFSRQFCGASLIDRDWVLTAAHCVDDQVPQTLQVVVGLTDLDDTSNAEIRGVRGIYIHPSYVKRNGNLYGDIALILLEDPVTNITPIEINRTASDALPGLQVRALGWGDTLSTPRFPTELRMVDLNLVSNSISNQVYGGIDNRHLSARAEGKDTCSGDSGGPLFDEDGAPGADPLLVGITSFGIDCAQKSYPGIYTNVSTYASWIDSFLAQPTVGDPELSVSGRGFAVPAGSSFVSRLNGTNFGSPVRGGRSRIQRFALTNGSGGVPLSINASGATNSLFKINSKPKYLFQDATGLLNLRYRAPLTARRGKSRSLIRIITNDPARPTYVFNVLAKFKNNFQFSF